MSNREQGKNNPLSGPYKDPRGELLDKAWVFANVKHENQLDDEGKPYILHVEQVAMIVGMVTSDANVIAAAYLHDTLEDTETTYEELENEFGPVIADLVNEVTHEGKPDEIGYYFPRLHTKEGILIKYADRLSNLSRMGSWEPKRQAHYLRKSKFWKSSPNEKTR